MKRNKGITLIALIITIIVLLILAGIVLYLFLDGGPIEKARFAKFVTDFREIEEKVTLYVADKEIDKIVNPNSMAVEEMFPVTGKVTESEKTTIKNKIPTLQAKMEELTGKTIDAINLYWIDKGAIGSNKSHQYVIDIDHNQIYDYEGENIFKKRWHMLEDGNEEEEPRVPGEIYIEVDPKNISIISIKINIDYDNRQEKVYKIGENTTTWTNYTGEITLTSQNVLDNNWKNEDNTVTVYAKGKDAEGKESVVKKIIKNLDLEMPLQPEIEIQTEYPKLYWNGVRASQKVTIKYDTKDQMEHFYSLDDGTNWIKYVQPFETENKKTIMAKTVKKSGMEKVSSKSADLPAGAIGIAGYDNDYASKFLTTTYQKARIEVDESAWNGILNFRIEYKYARIRLLDKDNTILYTSNQPGVADGVLNAQVTIPTNTSYLEVYCSNSNGAGAVVTELQMIQEPQIVSQQYYAKLTKNGVEPPYSMISINYQRSSKEKMYSLDGVTWQQYTEPIKILDGDTIYAKGIGEDSRETATVSHTAVVLAQTITSGAYDGNEATYSMVGRYGVAYLALGEDTWNSNLRIKIAWKYARVRLIDENNVALYTSKQPGTSGGIIDTIITIPNNTRYIQLHCDGPGDGALAFEFQIVK